MARDVGGEAEEHRVAEREQADVAEQQIERARKKRKAQHLHEEHGIDQRRRDEQRRKECEA